MENESSFFHIIMNHLGWMSSISTTTLLILCTIVLVKSVIVYAKFDKVRFHQVNFKIFRCYYSLVYQNMTYIIWIMFLESCYFIAEITWIIQDSSTQIMSYVDLIWTITEVVIHLTCARVLVGGEFSLNEYEVIYQSSQNGDTKICPNIDKPFEGHKPFDKENTIRDSLEISRYDKGP